MKSILIEAEELNARIGDPGLKILHVTMAPVGTSPGHVSGGANSGVHLPGAIVFDIEKMSDESIPLPHSALSPELFSRRVRALGLDSSDEIVVYDEKGIYSGPRARYLFLNAGHEKVRILNGGLPAWVSLGYETSSEPVIPAREGDFSPRPAIRHFVDRQAVLQAIEARNTVLIDARSKERFLGLVDEPRAGLARGHIPTASSLPFTEVLNGPFLKTKTELMRILDPITAPDRSVIAYCGSGVTACIVALALEVADHQSVSVYDGSWSEWGS
jgi:thiosulfate/3-mercaptopyruvate sulfurtransferase